jgi:hypothetical protein
MSSTRKSVLHPCERIHFPDWENVWIASIPEVSERTGIKIVSPPEAETSVFISVHQWLKSHYSKPIFLRALGVLSGRNPLFLPPLPQSHGLRKRSDLDQPFPFALFVSLSACMIEP